MSGMKQYEIKINSRYKSLCILLDTVLTELIVVIASVLNCENYYFKHILEN
jgi:hypothetical protein